MEADWEIEIGGGAPVIEALWTGFIDLRQNPERIGEIAEAAAFPALARLLTALNGAGSPLWTAKCDLWQPDNEEGCPSGSSLACYIDLLPREGMVFADWKQAECFCRECIARLDQRPPIASPSVPQHKNSFKLSLDLIVRQAVAGNVEGFGVTAYLSVVSWAGSEAGDPTLLAQAMDSAMVAFAATIPPSAFPATGASKLQ
jgi:hypothetical protein